ncbi:uncharacterized protein V1513DRAFT_448298 [Lipomyces chichibuensis]|uniref:uncharacterized protein n=1 Tax=Lipomyces chichibuensis TaxID=1546026 RepID=UPI003343E8BC
MINIGAKSRDDHYTPDQLCLNAIISFTIIYAISATFQMHVYLGWGFNVGCNNRFISLMLLLHCVRTPQGVLFIFYK